jgi:ABC-type transporter Mla maintaining outer membrane lipid asymmetry ATPase subunit MlaF
MSETFHPAVIEMRQVRIGAPREPAFAALEDVNWTVLPGEFWVVAGQQYSGKSRLLMHAAGLVVPGRGSCRVFDCETSAFGDDRLTERLRIGYVFAGGKLFNELTIAENVALPLRYQKNLSPAEAARTVEVLLEWLELVPFAGLMPSGVAANWRQRAALARALVLQPELLLLDNPLGGLGGRHRHWLMRFLDRLARGHDFFSGRPMTIVLTTDDLRVWEGPHRKFAVLEEKTFSVLGSWHEVQSARSQTVKELLAEPVAGNL